jgi:hypothetical protein
MLGRFTYPSLEKVIGRIDNNSKAVRSLGIQALGFYFGVRPEPERECAWSWCGTLRFAQGDLNLSDLENMSEEVAY